MEEGSAAALSAQLEKERASTSALRNQVQHWKQKVCSTTHASLRSVPTRCLTPATQVDQVCATQHTLENNMERLFNVAKEQVDEYDAKLRSLRAAAPGAGSAPPSQRKNAADVEL